MDFLKTTILNIFTLSYLKKLRPFQNQFKCETLGDITILYKRDHWSVSSGSEREYG